MEGQAGARQVAQTEWQGRPLGVACQILGRIAYSDQPLLEHAPEGRLHLEAVFAQPGAKVFAHPGLPRQLFKQRPIGAHQLEQLAVAFQPDPAITADQFLQIGLQVGRQGEFAVAGQDSDHFIGRHPRRRRIPKRQRRQAIGMDVLRAFFQVREGGQGIPRLGIALVVHLNQDGAIPLDDQRVCGIVIHFQAVPWVLSENGSLVG